MYYRLYSLTCSEGIYIGVKVSYTEIDTTKLSLISSLRYYMNKHEKEGVYGKIYNAIVKCGFRGFTISFDSEVYTDKDEAYLRMGEIQKKIPNLLNDFIMTNEKVVCECGHNIRTQYLEQHKKNYCILLNGDSTSNIFN